jgi:predicted MPP superfamily phosphohydrolase
MPEDETQPSARGAEQSGRDTRPSGRRRGATRVAKGMAAAGGAAAAYMAFEAQWVECRQEDLPVPGLPAPWVGLTILHLADIHAGEFFVNERSLAKVVRWAQPLSPDLVFLTGDNLGEPERSRRCLKLLSKLRPPLGKFAVTGNHEYGLSKGPLARPRDNSALWAEAGVTLLADTCVELPARDGAQLVLCGADHVTGGYGLVADDPAELNHSGDTFPILLVHEPPESDSPLFGRFPLAFAGHTHGGQLRAPTRSGLRVISREEHEYLCGIHPWGKGLLVVTRGIGTSFLPFRLFTRPEATLWRLVYTSTGNQVGDIPREGEAHD